MFEMPYSEVIIAVNGEQLQRYSVRSCDAQSFAAERYVHYVTQLGKYRGSCRTEGGVHDRFEYGYIWIED